MRSMAEEYCEQSQAAPMHRLRKPWQQKMQNKIPQTYTILMFVNFRQMNIIIIVTIINRAIL